MTNFKGGHLISPEARKFWGYTPNKEPDPSFGNKVVPDKPKTILVFDNNQERTLWLKDCVKDGPVEIRVYESLVDFYVASGEAHDLVIFGGDLAQRSCVRASEVYAPSKIVPAIIWGGQYTYTDTIHRRLHKRGIPGCILVWNAENTSGMRRLIRSTLWGNAPFS